MGDDAMAKGSGVVSIRALCLLALAAFGAAVPLAAQSDKLGMLRGLAKGEWIVKYRDGSSDAKLCLKTGEELIQLKHQRGVCSRFLVEDSAKKVTIQYTCPKSGYGRTEIRRENSALVQLESQGIANGQPFDFACGSPPNRVLLSWYLRFALAES